MLYVIFGTDAKKARAKSQAMIASLLKRKPDAMSFRVTSENWNESILEELRASQGLFEQKYIVHLDFLFDIPEAKEQIIERLSDLKDSAHIFVLLEEKFDAKTKKKLEKFSEKIQEFSLPEKSEREFNSFALGDALVDRDRKRAWTLYQKALFAGRVPEEIHGLLFWQMKSVVLAARSNSPVEAGLKPFVYSKSKRALEKYSKEELEKALTDLVTLYHESRMGGLNLQERLERFVLGI